MAAGTRMIKARIELLKLASEDQDEGAKSFSEGRIWGLTEALALLLTASVEDH